VHAEHAPQPRALDLSAAPKRLGPAPPPRRSQTSACAERRELLADAVRTDEEIGVVDAARLEREVEGTERRLLGA
jgi:hypothetical protein